jgi:hypothetical protein
MGISTSLPVQCVSMQGAQIRRGSKLAVVVVSTYRHLPALELPQTRLYILPCRTTKSQRAWRWTDEHPFAAKQIPGRKQSGSSYAVRVLSV